VHPCKHDLKRLTDVLVDVYYSNCNANEPTFPSLPLSVSLFSSLWTLHFSSLFIFSSSPSIPLDTNITITHIPYSYPRHLTPTTPIPHHICPRPTTMSAKTVQKDKEEVTPRSTLTHIGNWRLGPTLGRGAYGMSLTFDISALT